MDVVVLVYSNLELPVYSDRENHGTISRDSAGEIESECKDGTTLPTVRLISDYDISSFKGSDQSLEKFASL